ncbi:MAG: hypothetical protein U0136_21865 [Bdellovibrionota bacterium]
MVESIRLHSRCLTRRQYLMIWFTGTEHFYTPESEILLLRFVRRRWDVEPIQSLRALLGGDDASPEKFLGSLHEVPITCSSRRQI